MHIPDGFLDPLTAGVCYIVAVIFIVYSLYRTRASINPEIASMASILAAGIFAAQMLNWPLPGGTSLHMVGGALAGILLGPWLGGLVIFIVLLIQCLVFGDGGITALGANVLNMAIVDVLVGYLIYRAIAGKGGRPHRWVASFLGGWLGIALAGIVCGLEIGYSPSFPYGVAVTVPVMGLWHLVLGVIEGLITAFIVDYISIRSPSLILGGVLSDEPTLQV
ncbi:energy-coupling factor ABC transporter permease [Candidatus Bathyarchaeota archaeon]|nr:energy-coupling factor ABC transporter permease [Candidatus Bathyarchaeota archaeon]